MKILVFCDFLRYTLLHNSNMNVTIGNTLPCRDSLYDLPGPKLKNWGRCKTAKRALPKTSSQNKRCVKTWDADTLLGPPVLQCLSICHPTNIQWFVAKNSIVCNPFRIIPIATSIFISTSQRRKQLKIYWNCSPVYLNIPSSSSVEISRSDPLFTFQPTRHPEHLHLT